MKTMKTFWMVAMLMLCSFAYSNAQELSAEEAQTVEMLKNKPLNGFLGISFTNSVPQKEFYDNMKRSGPGFSVYGGYSFDPIPLSVGLQGDFLFYGADEKYFKYRNQGGWAYAYDTVSYSNMIIPITASIKFQPSIQNFVFPYIEGFAGFNIISASAEFNTSYGVNDSKSDIAASWNYGVGAGFMVKLVDFIQLPNMHTRMLLDVRARYMKGTSTEYHMVKQINEDTSPDFREATSKTDMTSLQIGLVFQF